MSALDLAELRARGPRHAAVADWIESTLPTGCMARVRHDPRPIGLVQRHGCGPYRVLQWEDCGDAWRPTIETPEGLLSLDPAWLVRDGAKVDAGLTPGA